MASECTIVVPLRNDAAELPTLHLRLTAMMRRLAIPYDIIYVDNGSTDDTPRLLAQLHEQDEAARGLVLSRRFNAQAALCAGLEVANGRAVITIDGNREDPPEVIPRLIEAWHEGYEVVFARRRRSRSAMHRAASFICHRLLRLASEIPIPTDTGEITLMDRRAVEELNSLPERTRFVTGLRSWVGFRQVMLEYEPDLKDRRRPRLNLARQLRTVGEGLLSFSNAPLRISTVLGGLVVGVALGGLLGTWIGDGQAGDGGIGTRLASALALVGGVQLLCIGVLGEYLSRIYQEVRGRPHYVLRERIGFRPHPRPVRNVVEFLPSDVATRQELATRNRLQRAELNDSLVTTGVNML